jgi:hypothetical protein
MLRSIFSFGRRIPGWRKGLILAAILGIAVVAWMYTDQSRFVSKSKFPNLKDQSLALHHPVIQRTPLKSVGIEKARKHGSRLPDKAGRSKLDASKEPKKKPLQKDSMATTSVKSSHAHKEKVSNNPSLLEGGVKQDAGSHAQPSLPSDVINRIEKFVFFIGYQRSGHSIIGSFMDAHPHMIIAHEFMLFTKWKQLEDEYQRNKNHHNSLKTKSFLFNSLYWDSLADADHGWRSGQLRNKNYTLTIDSQWQGRYDGYIRVIGDKSGGMTTSIYTGSPKDFEAYLADLKRTIGTPVKVLHVVRNPFDMIATDALYSEGKRRRSETGVKQAVFVSNFKKKLGELKTAGRLEEFEASRLNNQTLLESRTKSITRLAFGNRDIIRLIGEENVLELHNGDLVKDPISTLNSICNFLEVDCTERYLKACADKVFKTVSNTRELVVWPSSTRKKVESLIRQHSFFSRYSFDSD